MFKRCRFPKCYTKKLQRFGLCNKHRKWVEKGFFDQELNPLKPLSSRMAKPKKCKITDCSFKTRKIVKGFCDRHYRWYHDYKIMTEDGRMKRSPRTQRYPKDFTCIVCDKGGKITRGFCKLHYRLYQSGRIDFDGFQLRPALKVARYTEQDRCKIKGCGKKPSSRHFCRNHYDAIARGSIDETGKRLIPAFIPNKGQSCSVEGCGKPCKAKGYCGTHYRRYLDCLPIVREFKNKGRTCKAVACGKPAHCQELCTMHYNRRRRRKAAANPPQPKAPLVNPGLPLL